MLFMSTPMGRIIMRIVVLFMSAPFMHMLAHFAMPSPMEESAQIVQACSAAAQASIQSCIAIMSMDAGIPSTPANSMDMLFIISAVMFMPHRPFGLPPGGSHQPSQNGSAFTTQCYVAGT
jgi:hypothetical protein